MSSILSLVSFISLMENKLYSWIKCEIILEQKKKSVKAEHKTVPANRRDIMFFGCLHEKKD